LRKPDLKTADGVRISNGLLTLSGAGELSIKKAAALLVEKQPRGATKKTAEERKKRSEDVGREWLKSLAADELLNWLQKDHDGEWRCSRCQLRSEPSPTRTRPSSTDCCSRPQPRRSPPLPAIPSTLAPISASPLCCTLGARTSSTIRMCIA